MMKTYRYTVEGSGADGQTFRTDGTVSSDFSDALHVAMIDTFEKLTHGRALYGKPGVGCRGPYDIHRVLIEQVQQ
jgi:hypothetical protein